MKKKNCVLLVVLALVVVGLIIFISIFKNKTIKYPCEVDASKTKTYKWLNSSYYIKYDDNLYGKEQEVRYTKSKNNRAIEFIDIDNLKCRYVQKQRIYKIDDENRAFRIYDEGELTYNISSDELLKIDTLTEKCILSKENFEGKECYVEKFSSNYFYYNDNQLIHVKLMDREINIKEFSTNANKDLLEIDSSYIRYK